jgi:hypothetical protein
MYSTELFDELKSIKFQNIELDINKINDYLHQVNQDHKCLIKYILDNTIHIKTDTINNTLREMTINYLKSDNKIIPDYVFLPKKIGSEQYFFSQIYDLFPSISIPNNIISDYKFPEELSSIKNVDILIVDDASFSGINTIEKIDKLVFLNKKIKFNFIIIIPYQLKQINQDYLNKVISPNQISRINIIQVPGFIIPPYIELNNTKLENDELKISTCFFDHKVPNNHGSWPQIYLQGKLYTKGKKDYGSLFINDHNPTKKPILDVFTKFGF